MHIKDIHGKTIEVTDLQAAITQAETFSTYEDKDRTELTQTLKLYWQDVLEKLRQLQKHHH